MTSLLTTNVRLTDKGGNQGRYRRVPKDRVTFLFLIHSGSVIQTRSSGEERPEEGKAVKARLGVKVSKQKQSELRGQTVWSSGRV